MNVTATQDLLAAEKDGIVTLTLNRPHVLNSLTLGMMKGLLDSLKNAEKDKKIRCVVLTAAGRAFCAGADLGDLNKRRAAAVFSLGDELRRHFNPLIAQIRRM